MFMKCTLHVRRSTPSDVVLCELGQVPLHPMISFGTKCFCYSWLSDYKFQGLIANGTFSISNAMTTLGDSRTSGSIKSVNWILPR